MPSFKTKHLTLKLMLSITPILSEWSLASETLNHCSPGEKIYFSCQTKNGKIISLCGESADASNTSLSYAFGRKQKVELIYPSPTTNGSVANFKYNNYFRYGVDYYRVSFINGKYKYSIYRDIDEEATPSFQAGVIVEDIRKKNSKEFKIACETNITENLKELSKILACDHESALGCAH